MVFPLSPLCCIGSTSYHKSHLTHSYGPSLSLSANIFDKVNLGFSEAEAMGEYSRPPLEGNYTVSYNEDQGGMEVIYDITNIFLDAVIKPNMFPKNFLSDNFRFQLLLQ